MNRANRSKKTGDSFEKRIFLYVLDIFHPFYAKERLRANRSCYRERFAPVSRGKKRDRSDSFFFTSQSLFCSQKTSDSLQKTMSEFPILHNHTLLGTFALFMWDSLGAGMRNRKSTLSQKYSESLHKNWAYQCWSWCNVTVYCAYFCSNRAHCARLEKIL